MLKFKYHYTDGKDWKTKVFTIEEIENGNTVRFLNGIGMSFKLDRREQL